MSMIEMKDVTKWYGTFQVLTNCTTNVDKGEVVVVCGPSGSGKSTLIKVVNALEPFQKGDIVVDGISVNDPKTEPAEAALARRHGVPELRAVSASDDHGQPHARARSRCSAASKDEAIARGLKYLDRVGLIEQKDKYPGQLSGGQQQRVAIARALSMDPDRDAVRRADVGARPGDDQRGARRDGRARPGGHDDDGA